MFCWTFVKLLKKTIYEIFSIFCLATLLIRLFSVSGSVISQNCYMSFDYSLRHRELRPCERQTFSFFVVLWNSKHGQLQKFCIYQKYCIKIVMQKFFKNVMKIITKLRLHFEAKNVRFKFKNICLRSKIYVLRPKMYQGPAKEAQFCVL